jgi:hypothetical protein
MKRVPTDRPRPTGRDTESPAVKMRYRSKLVASVGLLAVAFTGCVTSPVYLQHPITKEIAKCGPYDNRLAHQDTSLERERDCIRDFQRQGFERMAKPPE